MGLLLRPRGVMAAALLDVDSGLTLAVRCAERCRVDLELVTAVHADLLRSALDTIGALYRAGPPTELVLSHGGHLHHLVRPVADPHGDRLAVSVLVTGPPRRVTRVRRLLRRIGDAGALGSPRHGVTGAGTPAEHLRGDL